MLQGLGRGGLDTAPSVRTLLGLCFLLHIPAVSLALAEQKNQASLTAMEQLGGVRPPQCSIGAPKWSHWGCFFPICMYPCHVHVVARV